MKFGATLRKSIYPPWKDQYIDYDKLKNLLREHDEDKPWTSDDVTDFTEELANVQLEKVYNFKQDVQNKLKERTTACEKKLEPLAIGIKAEESKNNGEAASSSKDNKSNVSPAERKKILEEVLKELDGITKEVKELEKYGRINYTAVIKATKKHDKLRGRSYRLRPFINARLTEKPIYTEDQSSLLYRLSAMYSFVRQSLDGKPQEALSFAENATSSEDFTSYKFWVHKENLLEVKTVILRRLPVLVYNPQTSKIAEGTQRDPTITSIYFDNQDFPLYTDKVNGVPNAASLRLRWYGQLAEEPNIFLEKKEMREGDAAEEQRFAIKEKYIQPFITGKYHMEKQIQKMEARSIQDEQEVNEFKKTVDDISNFIKEKDLQPVLRANYTRTAFQIPGDNRVRVSLDTNLALIREDSLDLDRPCRDPDDWHRRDIDDRQMEYPFKELRKGERYDFPHAILEIKVKGMKKYEWIEDLINSHLVKEAPRFSKFVQGVAKLFEDQVNTFPFWLSEVETDIKREPEAAFEEEQKKKQKAAEDDFAVGSLFGARASPSYRPSVISPAGSPAAAAGTSFRKPSAPVKPSPLVVEQPKPTNEDVDSDEDGTTVVPGNRSAGFSSLFPSFSTSKYARRKESSQQQVKLPPGIRHPGIWIKDQGPVRVEAKVWLANQRTFIKWQHVSVLLASLSLGLYNAAGEANNVARILAVVYTCVALFTLLWGYGIYMWRRRLITERSGKDFDNMVGPLVVAVGLAVALCLNFGFKYRAIQAEHDRVRHNGTAQAVVETLLEHIELVR
ncbi:Phosphate metabolism transcription protein [Didymosphaeria variabile]|uniref:Phosphate metabolism transcription protein n=1 Tax=Didymosphaeria variabile TaxID=1932322 RepID=A0A9W8XES3_9PLEO|nr:Phosphate metabolism transcription protein [Didymosphaeria variabile]KAJ4347916.1 Phosphate metabolism transcription protein [Didymosphaeria variabile]